MLQVLSAYGREGVEAIIIVTFLLAKAAGDYVARRNVLAGVFAGFGLGTTLVLVASDKADELFFGKYEGFSGSLIGLAISGVVVYHAVRQHRSIKRAGFWISFFSVLFETFEIGLQTLGVDFKSRILGMALAAAAIGLFYGVFRLVGQRPPAAQVQFGATLILCATAIWLIVKSFDVLDEKNSLWFGYGCLVMASILIVTGLVKGRPERHTAKLKA